MSISCTTESITLDARLDEAVERDEEGRTPVRQILRVLLDRARREARKEDGEYLDLIEHCTDIYHVASIWFLGVDRETIHQVNVQGRRQPLGAFTLFGFSARRTLSAAQALYERHKAITYPRTNSKFLSGDLVPEIKHNHGVRDNAIHLGAMVGGMVVGIAEAVGSGYLGVVSSDLKVLIPLVIIVLLFQRRIVAGLTSGAVKG